MNALWHDILRHREAIMLPLGLALAVFVTLHVLLRKREVASAVGWIGLAWFAPLTGAIAYFVLGVNRVQRRARRLRPDQRRIEARDDDDAGGSGDHHLKPLEEGIGRLTGRAVLGGNAIQIYQDGDQAYPPMLDCIAGAAASVGLSSYIFHDDEWGGRFIDALAAAHERGVAVRVLVDGIGGGWLRSPAYHHLRRRGVPAARFLHSPLPWRMPFLNLRSHRKVLVVDAAVGFTGGMNISDNNVMATHPKAPVQDTHFRFAGPVIRQLTEAFAQDWLFAADEELSGAAWFPNGIEPAPDGAACLSAPARVVSSGPDEDIEKLEFAMLQAVACARDSIVIMTPYFLPDDRLITALSMAAMRGVSVDVVIPAISDHRMVDWATRANVGPLLSDGVRLWLCPPPFRHSKAMIVDGLWCLIGSCNWDIRSFRLNFELCIECYDQAVATALAEFVTRSRGAALTQADLDARSMLMRLRDSATRLALPYL